MTRLPRLIGSLFLGALLVTSSGAFAQATAVSGNTPNNLTNLGTLLPTDSRSFGNFLPGSGLTEVPSGGSTFNFLDGLVFTVTTSQLGVITATLNLGTALEIQNLQAAVYQDTPFATSGLFPNNAAFGSFTGIASPGVPAVSGLTWFDDQDGSSNTFTLSTSSLAAGTYTLAIRGWVTGTSGGSYTGLLLVSPVPEASALALMGLGLLAGGALVRARRRMPA